MTRKRDIKRLVEEYEAKYTGTGTCEGMFYVSDIEQIVELNGNPYDFNNVVSCIFTGLQAGFMIGYKKGLRDAKKKTAADKKKGGAI